MYTALNYVSLRPKVLPQFLYLKILICMFWDAYANSQNGEIPFDTLHNGS